LNDLPKWILGTLLVLGILFSFFLVFSESATTARTWDPVLGWDFQCHSHTHPHLEELTTNEIRQELEQVNVAFKAHGYSSPNHLAYPYGGWDQEVKATISQYRLAGRTVDGYMETYPISDWLELQAAPIKSTTEWSKIKDWVDNCIKSQTILHIFTHRVSKPSDQ
jgi:peptidoglycan/xylan/chitin deacetylase (PgdA/CDA1 family)